jgi:hypothetical protein
MGKQHARMLTAGERCACPHEAAAGCAVCAFVAGLPFTHRIVFTSAVVIHWLALCRAVEKCTAYVPAHCLPIADTCERRTLARCVDPVDRPCRDGKGQAEKAASVDAWQRLGRLEDWREMRAKAE